MLTRFHTRTDSLPLPIFFPDATRAVVKCLDSQDIKATETPGILVNTYHLYQTLSNQVINQEQTISQLMNWSGAIISDSGGFQVMSLARKGDANAVIDRGVKFNQKKPDGSQEKILFTPEMSIRSQFRLKTDLLVVLDDFTPRNATHAEAAATVQRTIAWAKRSKAEFEKICQKNKLPPNARPYLIGVVQGGYYQDLRQTCAEELIKIGFDGLGFGGWPLTLKNKFDYQSARTIAAAAPTNYLLYGLGIGKPEDIVGCHQLGFQIFDCVLPTRDARHGRLYVFNAEELAEIDPTKPDFYHYLQPQKKRHANDQQPVSTACDCLLCQHYSRAYLHHLFRIKDITALRLATIHNLRFYSLLMEKLQNP